MPIVIEPRPHPSTLDYMPAGAKPYRVTNGDSWWTLADRPDVKGSGLSANDLCYLNFRTRNPAEINWYLYHKVGCRTTTVDGHNYCFSAADRPGVVYLPAAGPPHPVNEIRPIAAQHRLNAWLGMAGSAGTQFIVAGIETMVGYVASLDDFGKGMAITASINRLGLGFGAAGGFSIIFISGVNSPSQLDGHQEGGWDYNVALGPKWGELTKKKSLQPAVDLIMRFGARTPSGLKKVIGSDPAKWVEATKTGRAVLEYLGIDRNGPPSVFVLGLPWGGGGAEASVFFGVSNFYAVWDNQ